ncbi:MAG: PP2C family serine/threonine-protein phosphatase [Rickettsiales bacterium]|nr:PP2C family serine/threonine-protein phosphatase [Rickettsiales bacterium]
MKKLTDFEKELKTLHLALNEAITLTKAKFIHHYDSLPEIDEEEYLTYFDNKTLEQFLIYLSGLSITVIDEIYNVVSTRNLLSKANIIFFRNLAENKDFCKSRKFFHQFILEFNQERASQSCAIDNGLAAKIKEIPTQSLLASNRILAVREKNENLSGNKLCGNIDIFYAKTIGPREKLEDAIIGGKIKQPDSIEDSPIVPFFLEKTIKKLGDNLIKFFERNNIEDGSTALMAFYSIDQKLTIANIGDSRAILFIRKPDGTFDYKRLTDDHEPQAILEQARIESLGGFVSDARTPRVNEILSLSRSIGDIHIKYGEQRLISGEPDIFQYDIAKVLQKYPPRSSAILAICCDGMFDHGIANERTYAKALEKWFNNIDKIQDNFTNVAQYLRDTAILLGSGDNVTISLCDITAAPTEQILIGVFDGHGGDIASSLLAGLIAEEILQEDSLIHLPNIDVVKELLSIKKAQLPDNLNDHIISYLILDDNRVAIDNIKDLDSLSNTDYSNLLNAEFEPFLEFARNGGEIFINPRLIENYQHTYIKILLDEERKIENQQPPNNRNKIEILRGSLLEIENAKAIYGLEAYCQKLTYNIEIERSPSLSPEGTISSRFISNQMTR